MKRNVTACSAWRLYVIIDRRAVGSSDLVEVAAAAIRGGADVLQLRDKAAPPSQLIEEGKRLLPLARAAGIPFIINDHADIAAFIGADGIHVVQEQLPAQEARRLLGPGRLIGKSTHSLEQALAAEAEGADYLGFGPIFPTPTKPDYDSVGTALISTVARQVRLPLVCIGGIDDATIGQVVEAGATCVAVVRAVCRAPDPEAAACMLKNALNRPPSTVHSPR